MAYALVTPTKDEENSLPELIESIKSQSVPPVLWVVVDDGSVDSSRAILKEAKSELPYLKIVRLELKKRNYDLGFRYSYLVKKGIDVVLNSEFKKEIEYLGIIDADMYCAPDYFQHLLERFKKEPKLGIASGIVYSKKDGNFVREGGRPDLPRGSGRLISVKCLLDCGGYKLYRSMDSVLNIKAQHRGWLTRSFSDLKIYQARETSSRYGYWQGFFHKGETNYYLGFSLFSALLKSIYYTVSRPHYTSLSYLLGYLSQILKKEKKIPDKEIRDYYRKEHLKRSVSYHLALLKEKVKKNV